MTLFVEQVTIRPYFIAALAIISLFLMSIIAITAFIFALITIFIYTKFFVRTNPNKWKRDSTSGLDPEQKRVYLEGKEYIKKYLDLIEQVDIISDGLHLFGEYLNFNSNKTVIIIPGRNDGIVFSYYFAKPYVDEGFNVLFIDSRAHGLSEGKYISVGLKEYKDIQNWARFLKEKYNDETVVIHGLSIGGATGIYALSLDEVPSNIKGIVVEGLYTNFYETFKNHLIEIRKPVFPFAQLTMILFYLHSSIRPRKYGPINYIEDIECPILMIQSNDDIYSLPLKAGELYEKCGSFKKEIVYFDDAPHSLIRLYNKDEYDLVIKHFLRKNFK